MRCRRLTIGDAMILIASAAVGFGGARLSVDITVGMISANSDWTILAEGFRYSVPCIASLTVGWLAIRLRGPRPGRRRLMRQPGMTACCTVVLSAAMSPLVAALATLKRTLATLKRPQSPAELWDIVIEVWCDDMPLIVGFAVFVAWCTLALGDRWRREEGWIDGMGTLLGVSWIAISVVGIFLIA